MNAYRTYTNANVSTASAQRIMMTLFETALRHMRAARAAYTIGDYRTGGLFQTGSKMPLPNRMTMMFWTVSLPR